MLAFAAIIAGSFSLGARAVEHLEPAALNAVRFCLGLAVLTGAAAAAGALRRDHFRAPWRFGVLGGLFAVYFVLMFVALRLTDPVPLSAVFTTTPLLAAAFGWAVLGQRPGGRMSVGIGLALLGALWVIFRGDWDRLAALEIGLGERIYFLGCAAHALYAVMVRRLNRGEPVVAFSLGTTAGGAAVLLALGAPDIASAAWSAMPPVFWLALAYLAVFATAGTFFLLQFAALRLPAGTVMAYGYLVPSFVILYEGLFGGGWADPVVLPGVALTVAAMLLLASSRR